MFHPVNFTQDSQRYGRGVVHGGGKGKAPAAPDPVQTAAAQTGSNVTTATANAWLQNPNQVTPYGNITNRQTGTQTIRDADGRTYDIPTFTSTTSLNPQDQQLLDTMRGVGQQAGSIGSDLLSQSAANLRQPMDTSGLPPLTQDFSADRARVESAFMDRFNKDYAQRGAAMDQKLANQGVAQGTEAARAAYRPLEEGRNDALTQAILAGGQEQSRLQGLAQGTRQQGIQEEAFKRYEPINVASGLFGLGPGVQTPQFTPFSGSGVAGTDVMGAYNNAYQQNLARYQTQQAGRNAAMGGIGSLLGTGLGIAFSDVRVKKDIKRIGELDSGLPIYRYRYAWDPPDAPMRTGVMAQEAEVSNPDAVGSLFGVKAVDYQKIVEDE